jgi:DNA-binding NtrC family response regulator
MESELFGAEAGAYTSLRSRRLGHFESANGGTLFLDEIDALSLAGQVKLLRVLQSGEFQRLGSSRTLRADVRVVSATNIDLEQAIARGGFREDLYFRLNVVEIPLPGLKERRDDILPLAEFFLASFAAEQGADAEPLTASPEAERALLEHDWPGNVRELENRIQRATLVAAGPTIEPSDLGFGAEIEDPSFGTQIPLTGAQVDERRELLAILESTDGIVARAAGELGISRQALYRKMTRLGIELERRPKAS